MKISPLILILVLLTLPLGVLAKTLPNDTDLSKQYYLEQVKATNAWDFKHDTPEVIVAVIDSGVDIDHPDLAENIWQNPDEIKDWLDNDGNGLIDDISGWDFVLNTPDPRPKFGGDYSTLGIDHGTVVAGVIGAVGNNNFGLSGITWQVKIMPLKVMDGNGSGATNLVYQAINYAVNKGADIINLSMVGDAYDPLLAQAIADAYQHGVIIVASAGNEKVGEHNEDLSLNLNLHPQYPVCHDGGDEENYILGIGSVNPYDVKSLFSNYGKCIDIMAPGEGFWALSYFSATVPGFNNYFNGYWSGTSVATPLVSGTAALVKSLRPDLTNEQIYNLIIHNADNIDNSNSKYFGLLGGGRLNINRTLSGAGGLAALGGIYLAPALGKTEIGSYNSQGNQIDSFTAYTPFFNGGADITAVDFDSDGMKEIITAAGSGGGPHVKVFQANGQLISQFFAYNSNFSGGVNLVAGDVDGDGQAEIITAPKSKLSAQIKIFSMAGKLKGEFLAYEKTFTEGVYLALSDINFDGTKEIVTAPSSGRSAEIKIFNSAGRQFSSFWPYEKTFSGGVKIAAYNLLEDGRTEIITVPENDPGNVHIFNPSGDLLMSWAAWDEGQTGYSDIDSGDVDKDGFGEIIMSKSTSEGSVIKILKADGQLKYRFTPFDGQYQKGFNLTTK